MTQPITVEVTLDLDKYVHAGFRQTGEEDYEPIPATIETLIIDQAARQIRSGVDRDIKDDLRDRVDQIRDEEIRARIVPIVEAQLAAPLAQTNRFGEQKGEPTTLAELIRDEAHAEIKRLLAEKGDNFSRRPGRSALQEMVAAEVGATFTKECKAELDKAKAEILAAVRARGAELLAETVTSMAGKLG